jgi:putative oxidoreductase
MSHLSSLGLLILRVVIGLIFFAHGSQKLFGWFGGRGFAGEKSMMEGMGLRPGWLFGALNALGEFLGGLGLAAGFLTPFAAVGALGAMIVAIARVHWAKGFFNHAGGFEFPLTLAAAAFVIGLIGPGEYSLDAAFPLRLPWPWTYIILLVLMLAVDIYAIARPTSPKPQT